MPDGLVPVLITGGENDVEKSQFPEKQPRN
jgi:hypothetical protein